MAEGRKSYQIVEIQALELHPESCIDQRSSPARKALEEGLKVTAKNPKCLGVYWMNKEEKSEDIVVISKWQDQVGEIDSKSYLPTFKPYISHEALPSISIEDDLKDLTGHSVCNILMFHFPINKCTEALRSTVHIRAKRFINYIYPLFGRPANLRFLTSGWSSKAVQVNGDEMIAFLICSTWADRQSEDRFKNASQLWKDFLEDVKALGCVSQDDCHGKLLQVYGENPKYAFEESDLDDDDEEIDVGLENMGEALARMRKIAEEIAKQYPEDHSCGGFTDLESNEQNTIKRRLKRIE